MDWVRAHQRFLLLACVAATMAWLVLQGSGRAPATADVVQAVASATRVDAPAPDAAPQVDLSRLAQRNATRPDNDLFDKRTWRPPAAPKAAPTALPPQEAPLPPVPYTYLGRWTENAGKSTVVVLGREGRSYLVRVNDVLEGAWRIDAVEPARIVLTYLPRNAVQVIAVATGAQPGGAQALQAKSADAADIDAVLQVTMPDRATVGDEIAVRVSLDVRKTAMVERSSVEVRYDPVLLRLVGREGGADPGRVQLEVGGAILGHGGPTATARLRVVAADATTTQITFANMHAADSDARAVAVTLDGPNPRPLTLVRSPK